MALPRKGSADISAVLFEPLLDDYSRIILALLLDSFRSYY